MNWGVPFLWIGFWVFLSVSSVAGIVSEYKKRRLELEPLRAAIERGQQLDPAIIERLMAREQHETEIDPLHLRLGGIIVIAVAIGLALLAIFLQMVVPKVLFVLFGVGALGICIGVGLLIAARVLQRARTTEAAAGTNIIRGTGE
jgi:small-conductance mechanosensitive channel